VVDLGCGAGFDIFQAANKIGKTGKAIGIDMSEVRVLLYYPANVFVQGCSYSFSSTFLKFFFRSGNAHTSSTQCGKVINHKRRVSSVPYQLSSTSSGVGGLCNQQLRDKSRP
jgi:hypothetical protein